MIRASQKSLWRPRSQRLLAYFLWMFGEKAVQARYFTKHPQEFAACGSRKALLRSPG
jgi:hypothetical protein